MWCTLSGWWLYETYGDYREQRETASEYSANDTARYGQSLCLPVGPFELCRSQEPQAKAKEASAEYDLQAQQDMATWALGVFLASVGTLGLTGAGVILLWLTLRATNETLREARNTTSAAEGTNRIATEALDFERNAMKLVGRPFVFVNADIPTFFPWVNEEKEFVWTFAVVNFGESPAVMKSIKAGIALETEAPEILDVPETYRRGKRERVVFTRHPLTLAEEVTGRDRVMLKMPRPSSREKAESCTRTLGP